MSPGNGRLEFNEFVDLMSRHFKTQSEMEDELKQAFRMFDANNDGFITAQELQKMMKAMGEKLTNKEIDALIKAWDTDGDGRINYDGQ
jgi:calcium-binding protein CML